MFTQTFTITGMAMAAAIAVAPAANAATFTETFTHNYGTGAGDVAPIHGSGGTMRGDHVRVEDRADSTGNRFFDAIDFSSLAWKSINSITLTLGISDARDRVIGIPYEDWRVFGSTNGGTSVADRTQMGNRLGSGDTWSITLTGGDVFAQALTAGKMAFWFGEETFIPNSFRLYSASLTIDGIAPAPIPLPATGLLLIGSLGGLAALRRRKKIAA